MGLLNELGVELSEKTKTQVTQTPTTSVSAYEDYSTALNLIDAGNFKVAVSQLKQAIQQDASYAEAYHALGWAHGEQGEVKQALNMYEKAADLYEKAENYYGMVEALTDAAELLHDQSQLEPAAEIYLAALEIAQVTEDYYAQGRIFTNLGWMAMELEMWEESSTYFEGAASIFESLGEEEYYGQAAFGLGALYHASGDHATAAQYLAIAEQIGNAYGSFWMKDLLDFKQQTGH